MDPQLLSIVIPSYDEIVNLEWLLPTLNFELNKLTKAETKVYVILRNQAAELEMDSVSKLHAIPVRRGPTDSFGDAIRTGLEAVESKSTFVLIMDADGSHSPQTVPILLSTIMDTRADVVIASRYISGGSSDNSIGLRLMSRILNYTFAFVLGIRVKDVSTNFKIYRTDLVKGLILTCNNFDIVEELLLEVKRKKGTEFRVLEIPDRFNRRVHGQSKRKLGVYIATYILTLIRLRFRRF